jgi:hypothetical protein
VLVENFYDAMLSHAISNIKEIKDEMHEIDTKANTIIENFKSSSEGLRFSALEYKCSHLDGDVNRLLFYYGDYKDQDNVQIGYRWSDQKDKFSEEGNDYLERLVDESAIVYNDIRHFMRTSSYDITEGRKEEIKKQFYKMRTLSNDIRKEISARNKRLCDQYNKIAVNTIESRANEERETQTKSLVDKLKKQYYFPVGSDVKIEWAVDPSTKKFKLTDISCKTIDQLDCVLIYQYLLSNSLKE